MLLLALLRELGIQAEPALVSSGGGDGLDERLPAISAFDHVIVRATLGGKDYWLDGTRSGDSNLDRLRVPPFGWALPVRPQKSALVKLVRDRPDRPESETIVRIDASAGIDAPAKVRVEMVSRSDSIVAMRQLLGATLPADKEKAAQRTLEGRFPGAKLTANSSVADEKAGEYREVIEGTATIQWLPLGAQTSRTLYVSGANLGGYSDFKREPGPMADLPFAVRGSAFSRFSETVILPRDGVGFTLPAPDVDEIVAGQVFHRRSKIEKGVATIEATTRTIADEIPASEGPAAAAKLKAMREVYVTIKMPAIYVPTPQDMAAQAAAEPKTAAEYRARGGKFASVREYDKALADFEKAMSLDPKDAGAISARGLVRLQLRQFDLARADFAAAQAIDSRDVAALHGLAAIAANDGKLADAIALYGRAIDIRAGNLFALERRASLYQQTGEYDKALADVDELVKGSPSIAAGHKVRVKVLEAKQDFAGALAEIDAVMAMEPGDPQAYLERSGVLVALGRRAEALKSVDDAMKIKSSPEAYLRRSSIREKSDRAGRLADIEAALKVDLRNVAALEMRAAIRGEAGAYDKGVAELTQAMQAAPGSEYLLLSRATLEIKAGRSELAHKDFETMRAKFSTNANSLNSLCWTRATLGVELEAALADCDAALAIEPKSAATLDSRAFVLMRLGRYDEAVRVYDAALALRPRQADSLYGRGLSKLRLQ